MIGKDALVVLANLSQLMSEKMEEPILHVSTWVNGPISIAVARSYSCGIHGACLPSPLWDRDPDWELGLCLGLAQ